jgi:hypothetical protein
VPISANLFLKLYHSCPMTRYLRYLRIAFSAVCGIACVLIVVLWVRSYWWQDLLAVQIRQTPKVGGISYEGRLACGFQEPDIDGTRLIAQTHYLQHHPWIAEAWKLERTPAGFTVASFPGGWMLEVPHYFAVIVLSAVASLPWIRWRFSLRTLLIATTVVSLVLGLIIYATRG